MAEPFRKISQNESVLPLEPTAQIVAFEELREEAGGSRDTLRAVMQQPVQLLHAVKVSLQVCVGEAQLTVGELLDARDGQLIHLDRGIEQAVDLLLEGKVVARGQLVAVDGCFALRISELPVSLKI